MKLLVFLADTGNRDFIVIWCVLCKFVQLFSKRHDLVSQLFDVGEYRHSAPPETIDQFLADLVPSITASAPTPTRFPRPFTWDWGQPDALKARVIEGVCNFAVFAFRFY